MDDPGSGADVNAIFVSPLASHSLHKIEPLGCMRGQLCLLPSWPHQRVLDFAPVSWRETLEQHQARQALDASVFQRLVPGLPAASHRPQQLPDPMAVVTDG